MPGGWTTAERRVARPRLRRQPRHDAGPGGASVVAGLADKSAANPALLSQKVVKANGGTPSGRQTVAAAGGAQAYKYAGVNVGGGKQATFYVVPTSSGVATLACSAPAATCDSIASTAKVTAGKTFPLGPSKAYATRFDKALSTLAGKESGGSVVAEPRRHRPAQASATARLAGAYSAAARSLAKLKLGPADVQLNAALAPRCARPAARTGRRRCRQSTRTAAGTPRRAGPP